MAKENLTMTKLNRMPIGDFGANEYDMSAEGSTEYLLELQGRQGSVNYSKMSRSDAQIGMILNIYKNPIMSANWSVPTPDDIDENEERAIDVLNSWLFEDGRVSFQTLLEQVLSFIEFGFSCFEVVWIPYEYEGTTYLVPDLQQRLQSSIESIDNDRRYVQQTKQKGGVVNIPMEDVIFFTLNQQGNDKRGRSLLRTAYHNWKRKNYFIELLGIGMQRSATGVPYMEVPENTDIDSPDYLATEQLLKNITSHENAYMITKKGFVFDIKTFPFDSEKIQKAIDALDEKNAVSVLAQFILLGTGGGGGAYALSRDQSDMFLDGLNYIVRLIEQVFHRDVVRKYLDINFGGSLDATRIKLRGLNLNKKAGSELALTLQQLSQSGFIKATLDDEITLRQHLELPELSDEEIQRRQDNEEAQKVLADALRAGREEDEEEQRNETTNASIKLAEAKGKSRIDVIDFEISQMNDVMRANLLMIKDKLVADIRNTLERGSIEIKGLKNIDVSWSKYATNLERKLAGIANLGWNKAKSSSKANSIKLSEPLDILRLDNKELRQYVLNQAQSIAEDQVTSMKINAILTASNGPLKGYSIAQTMVNVDKAIEAFIEGNKVSVGGSLMVVGALNFGEQQFYQEIKDQLWGYRFVAIDDERTSEICSWYSGKTFSVDSAEMSIANPPLHPNCRSYLEPVYKTEEQIKIDDAVAPPSIQKGKSVY